MAGVLFTVVTAGVFATGCLFHFGHPIYAVCAAFVACALGRWVWSVYTD